MCRVAYNESSPRGGSRFIFEETFAARLIFSHRNGLTKIHEKGNGMGRTIGNAPNRPQQPQRETYPTLKLIHTPKSEPHGTRTGSTLREILDQPLAENVVRTRKQPSK